MRSDPNGYVLCETLTLRESPDVTAPAMTTLTYGEQPTIIEEEEGWYQVVSSIRDPQTGMIVGRNSRPGDIDVNVCKKKHMTNSRNSAAAEEALKITNVHIPTMEEALEFIEDDELVEITPKSIRMRKRVLNAEMRKKLESRKKQG